MEIVIRNSSGHELAAGTGREFRPAVERLYRSTGRPGRQLVVDQYFRTERGAPFGTHHCQFGRWLPMERTYTLDDPVVVHVA